MFVHRLPKRHYVVTPDNGTLTHIIRFDGIEAVREIDEHVNRLPRSASFTGTSNQRHCLQNLFL